MIAETVCCRRRRRGEAEMSHMPGAPFRLSSGRRMHLYARIASVFALCGVFAVSALAQNRTTERVSLKAAGGADNAASAAPSVSATGRFVAFESNARLTPDDTDAER